MVHQHKALALVAEALGAQAVKDTDVGAQDLARKPLHENVAALDPFLLFL